MMKALFEHLSDLLHEPAVELLDAIVEGCYVAGMTLQRKVEERVDARRGRVKELSDGIQ